MTKENIIMSRDFEVAQAAMQLAILTRDASVFEMVEGRVQMILGAFSGFVWLLVLPLAKFLLGKWIDNTIVLGVASHVFRVNMCVGFFALVGCSIAYIVAVCKAAKE